MTAIALQDSLPDIAFVGSASADRLPAEGLDKRTLANRANARKSTGPRTTEGKSRSSRNATKHGLCSLVPPPDLDTNPDFRTLEQELRDDLRPRTPTQHTLLRELA